MSTSEIQAIYRLPARPAGLNGSAAASSPRPAKRATSNEHSWRGRKVTTAIGFSMLLVLLTKGCFERAELERLVGEKEIAIQESQSSLAAEKATSDELAANLSAAKLATDKERKQHEALKALYVKRLLSFADFVSDDPALERTVLAELKAWAEKENYQAGEVSDRLAKIAPPKTLPAGSSASVAQREDFQSSLTVHLDVRDANGNFLPGLARGDFELRAAGHAVHPLRVEESTISHTTNNHISAVFDCSGSMAGEFADLKAAGKQLTHSANPWVMRVLGFSTEVTEASPWSTDAALHARAIDGLKAEGGTALIDALEKNLTDLALIDGRRATVLFTDGKDSTGKAAERASSVIAKYKELRIPVHVVVLDRGEIDADLLRRLALETSGSYQMVSSSRQLIASFDAVKKKLQQPVYRLVALGPLNTNTLTLKVGGTPVLLPPRGN